MIKRHSVFPLQQEACSPSLVFLGILDAVLYHGSKTVKRLGLQTVPQELRKTLMRVTARVELGAGCWMDNLEGCQQFMSED